jgi:hypothetical protein
MLTELEKKQAAQFAKALTGVNTNYRGDYFAAIAKQLRWEGQGYTASLFERIAQAYGISNVEEDE